MRDQDKGGVPAYSKNTNLMTMNYKIKCLSLHLEKKDLSESFFYIYKYKLGCLYGWICPNTTYNTYKACMQCRWGSHTQSKKGLNYVWERSNATHRN